MENKKTGFFEEEAGKYSMTRLLSFMIVSMGILMVLVPLVNQIRMPDLVLEVPWMGAVSIITTGITVKLIQKGVEVGKTKKPLEDDTVES